jgi:hypothetical protein
MNSTSQDRQPSIVGAGCIRPYNGWLPILLVNIHDRAGAWMARSPALARSIAQLQTITASVR